MPEGTVRPALGDCETTVPAGWVEAESRPLPLTRRPICSSAERASPYDRPITLGSVTEAGPLLTMSVTAPAAAFTPASGFVASTVPRAESLGYTCNVGIAERPERVIVLGVALLAGHVVAGLWVLVAATSITVVQRILTVWQQPDIGSDIDR